MILNDTINEAVGDMLDSLGAIGSFTPSTGDAIELNVFVSKSIVPQPFGNDGTAWESSKTILCKLSELPHEPNVDETFTVGTDTYKTKEVIENNGYFVRVAVK